MKGSITWTTSLTPLQPEVGGWVGGAVRWITGAPCVQSRREGSRLSEIIAVASSPCLFDRLFLLSVFFFLYLYLFFFFYIFKLSVVEMQKAAKAKQNDPSSVQNQKTVNVSPA